MFLKIFYFIINPQTFPTSHSLPPRPSDVELSQPDVNVSYESVISRKPAMMIAKQLFIILFLACLHSISPRSSWQFNVMAKRERYSKKGTHAINFDAQK